MGETFLLLSSSSLVTSSTFTDECDALVLKLSINYCSRTDRSRFIDSHWLLACLLAVAGSPVRLLQLARGCASLSSIFDGALSEGYHSIVTSLYLSVVAAGPHFRISVEERRRGR